MKNSENVNQNELKEKETKDINLKERNSSFENSEDEKLLNEIINKDYTLHFPKEKSSDDIRKLYKELHLEGRKEKENENEELNGIKIENDIEQILIDIYNYRYNNCNKRNLNLINNCLNKMKNWTIKIKKSNHIKIFSILIKKLNFLISHIKKQINFKKIEIEELIKIKNSLKLCAKDIEEILDIEFEDIGKQEIERILLNLFIDKILSEAKISLKEKEIKLLSQNSKDKFEQKKIEFEKGFTIKYNNITVDIQDLNKEKENINSKNNNNVNNNKIVKNTNKNIINGIITSNSLLKGHFEAKKYENIDDLVDYINEEDKKKKSRKKKKKSKKNKNTNENINENEIIIIENNLNENIINNNEENWDPIVINFKNDLNHYSDNEIQKKIRPTFSKKWLNKIEIMSN